MTIPIERTWAISNVREFLRSLCNPKETPKVPRPVRLQAARLLKHYPRDYDMEQAQTLAPGVFGDKVKKNGN
jgi:hypothetical protein